MSLWWFGFERLEETAALWVGKGERLTVYILELLNGRLCVYYAYYTIGF